MLRSFVVERDDKTLRTLPWQGSGWEGGAEGEAPMAYFEALSWHSCGFVERPKEATKISSYSVCQ